MKSVASGVQAIVGVTELRRRFRSLFDEVVFSGISYVLTRRGHPEAVLIPYVDFLRYQEFEERQLLSRYDSLIHRMALQNAGYSEDEVADDVGAAQDGLAAE